MSLIDDIKRDREAGTPDLGGWRWFGGRNSVYLATKRGGRRFVMTFARMGMQGAQPRFQIGGVMHGAIDSLTQYEVGDGAARGQVQADADPSVYRMDIVGIDHPDARRMERIPDMEAALLAAEELAEKATIMIGLCALKYGNLDADVWAEIEGAKSAFAAYRKATGAEQ